MGRKVKVQQGYDGEWYPVGPAMKRKLVCCDCGLTHTIQFRVVGGLVELRPYRNDSVTKAVRRGAKWQK